MNSKDTLIAWLRDAYAMEQNAAQMLDQAGKTEGMPPGMEARVRQHIDQTHRHAQLVEECLHRLDSDTSGAKTAVGKVSGFMSGFTAGMHSDAIVKQCLAGYAMEHFEIACYRSLVAAAEALGEEQVAQTCRRILAGEQEFASWVESQIPEVTQQYLAEHATH